MKRKIEIGTTVFLLLASVIVSFWGTNAVVSKKLVKDRKIMIDPGHGGNDPGKVAADGTLEKDLNLQIAVRLGEYLKNKGFEVYYTRQSDDGLYQEDDRNKKMSDLKKRCRMIENIRPDLVVSIHQNSYGDPDVHGAQVFYYTTSEEGKALGEGIQAGIVTYADPANKRKAKGNDSYYILKKTPCPIVIVECGFLSSTAECGKLRSEKYQKKLVEGIYQGILCYYQGKNKS